MKITDELRERIRIAVEQTGGANEFARHCGIDAANISRYLSGRVKSISDDNWEKLEKKLFVWYGIEKDYILYTFVLQGKFYYD